MSLLAGLKRFFLLDGDGKRNAAMEGLRGYAVLLVFFVHFAGIYGQCVRQVDYAALSKHWTPAVAESLHRGDWALLYLFKSHYGVDLFFLLSGFLICRNISHARQKGRFSYRRFLGRRLLRIYPAFLLSTFACLATAAWFFEWPAWSRWDCLGNLALLYGCPGLVIAPYNDVTWTLFYEASFYLVAPLLFLLLPKIGEADDGRQTIRLLGLLAIALFLQSSRPRATMFLFGMLLGATSDAALRGIARAVPTAAALCIYAATVAAYFLAPTGFSWFAPLFGTASSLLFIKACYGEGLLNRCFAWGPLRYLGNVSFSFYLLHRLGTSMLVWLADLHHVSLAGAGPCTLYFLAALGTSLGLATLSFAIAERWYFGWSKPVATRPAVEVIDATDEGEIIEFYVPADREALV